jgi:prepilin-type N-terminal cleavage/methylation domain-containing protein
MKKGFTLIELMIVIAIIAIIAAIAIPNLLSGRMSANETSCIGAMKLLTSAEALWVQQGPDGNGMKDYWVYDVSCLHRMHRADLTSKVAFIPMDLARADVRCAGQGTASPFGATPTCEIWTPNTAGLVIWPKSGYWYTVLDMNDLAANPNRISYPANNVGAAAILAGNTNQYGFMGVPDVYGTSGIRSFIVNEAGVVYAADSGVNNEFGTGFPSSPNADPPTTPPGANKWLTSPAETLCWPTQNPPAITVAAANKPWEASE